MTNDEFPLIPGSTKEEILDYARQVLELRPVGAPQSLSQFRERGRIAKLRSELERFIADCDEAVKAEFVRMKAELDTGAKPDRTLTELKQEAANYPDPLFPSMGLRPGPVNILVGYGCSGKSMLSLYMMICAAGGIDPWTNEKIGEPRKVLCLDYEGLSVDAFERAEWFAKGLGVNVDEFFAYNDRFVKLDDPSAHRLLTDKLQRYDLAVIDSIRAAAPSVVENEASARNCLDSLRVPSIDSKCSVLAVMHKGKGEGEGRKAIRGSSSQFDAAQSVFALDVSTGKTPKDSIYSIKNVKPRRGEDFARSYRWAPNNGGLVLQIVKAKEDDITRLLKLLTDKGPMKKASIKRELGFASQSGLYELLKDASAYLSADEKGLVGINDDGKAILAGM